MSDSIQVAIKVRPLIKREKEENLQIQWSVVDNAIVPVDPEKKRGELIFHFDHIFDPDKENSDVFEKVVKPIVDSAVRGFNGTVFAYGQTSSGKTYTMLGTPDEAGVIPMAVDHTFESIAETYGREFLLRVSYLEIYNEKVNDLLDTSRVDLKLREDSNGLVQVRDCKEEIANSPDVIMKIMRKGDKNRRIGETDMNDKSSRSHTIFRITIESRETSSDSDGAIQVSQLNLVDLAGSERARQTNATGERFKEGTHINMSLSNLALVIKQLSESDSSKYINFRDSKLTRLLQASLGGNAMTAIVCAVTPAAFEETQCTLSFASRAKSVKNKPVVNEVMSDAVLLKRYKKQLAKLNEELEKMKNVNRIAEVEEIESKLQEKDRLNQMLEERIELLKKSIISTDSSSREEDKSKILRSKRRRTWAGDRGQNLYSPFHSGVQNLPTIKETSVSPESKLKQIPDNTKRRKSIIQSVNLHDESFQTAFTDFELELIEGAKEREEEFDMDSITERNLQKRKPRTGNRVQFQDNVEIHRLSNESNWSDISTPVKSTLTQGDETQEPKVSPGTPKSVLRERLSYLTEEYHALQEFTTLERQILSAQQDFDSPTEKLFMEKQIEGLMERLKKYSSYQNELEEQLTLSLNCINGLSSRTPEILESWKPSLFGDDRGEVDIISELKQLEQLLANLKSEQNNKERPMSQLEKKLTDDYNECLKELEQVKSQKEFLFQENSEINQKLIDESEKLKKANIVINTLRTDTDCLMEKLIQKNSELAKLKERIVELEKVEEITEKPNTSVLENSVKNNDLVTNESQSVSEIKQNLDAEIIRLNEIIEEKAHEISKYRQFEEEMKLENESLQQSLDAYLKIERQSQECQTDATQEPTSEISNLSEMIKNQTSSIAAYQQLETDLQNKVDQLQQSLDAVYKVEKSCQHCQTDDVHDQRDSTLAEQNKEISRLTEEIQEKILEITNFKQLEEELRQEIERLQIHSITSKVETRTEGCQTLYFNDIEEDIKMQITAEKDLVISRLESVIQEITLEISRYKKSEEDAKQEIELLQSQLGNVVDISKQPQSEDAPDDTSIDKNRTNEISGLLELIELKSSEIERYQKSEDEMKMEIKQLQQCLENARKVERISVECQTKHLTEISNEADSILMQITDVSKQTAIIQGNALENQSLCEKEQSLQKENEQLVVDNVSVQCQTDKLEKLNVTEKDIRTIEELKIIDEKTETEVKELEISSQIKLYQEEIEALKNQAEISKEDSTTAISQLEMKVTALNEELSAKVKNIEELSSLNTVLKNGIDEKNDEILNLQRSFESKVQELEQQIDIIVRERNELKEKIDAVHTNDVAYDFEKEVINLRDIVDKLKSENENLKQCMRAYETEIKNDLSINKKSILIETPTKSHAILSTNDFNCSVRSPTVNLEDKSKSIIAVDENVPKSSDDHSFVKPESVLVDEPKVSAPLTKGDKSFVEPPKKKFELESSSIFANQSYFDNMEVSQSFVQDSTSIFTGMDESKNILNMSANIDTSLVNQINQNATVVDTSILQESTKDVIKSEDVQNATVVDASLLQESIKNVIKSEDVQPVSVQFENVSPTMEQLERIKVSLEKENARLSYDLENKIRETEEVQRVVSEFKETLEELQQTICILTNENMDMSKQLTEARKNNNVVVSDFQREIDALTNRLSAITEEKVSLKSELALLNDQYENARATTPVITDDEMRRKFFECQEKIKTLTDENIELSTNLMEKIEELEKVKESKVQLYDHECTYKEKAQDLIEKVDVLEKENIDLSSDLTEQIEECDKLKETVDVMKEQLEAYSAQQSSENSSTNDFEFLKQENTRLASELIGLRAKMTGLTRENANLSNNLALDISDEHNESASSSCGKTLNAFAMAVEASLNESNINDSQNIALMNKKIKELQEQVEHLTMLNKKLGELKLTNCSQCAHLKELNESRRELKLEVKSLNQKLADLQKKFQQKCADTEALRTKANEDLNASLSMLDSTLNGTMFDGVNVTVIEEKVQNLHCELEELKENHNKLSNQYKEKCNELEKLQYDNTLSSPSEKKETKRTKADSSSRKNSTRIQNLQKDLEKLSLDLQELKKVNGNTSTTLNKFMAERSEAIQEMELLKLANEEFKKECSTAQANVLHYEEKVKLLEEELSTLYKQIESANASEKEIQSQKLEIEVQLESLLKEKAEFASSAYETEEKFKKELEESNLRVQSYDKENNNLKNELQKLEDLVQQLKGNNENAMEEKLKDEIESAKSRIMEETKSLTSLSEADQKALRKKSVTDIFLSFLNAILSKEQEIIKRLQEDFERRIRKLEEVKQQCIDSEKRANVWAKTLETDLEKLQGDLTEQEYKNKRLESDAHRLEDNMKEVYHENQQLYIRISNLETELNTMQNEFEKKLKSNDERNSAINVAQEKERQAKSREEEWEDRLAHEKEKHAQYIEELNSQFEMCKSTNDDLKSTVEGLDLEIEHLKNTITIKTDDLAASLRKIEEMRKEFETMEDIHYQLRNEKLEKEKQVEDITGLLKIKCDLLTEYKTKVETMKPEYESLQAQISERKMAIEKYKEEIHALKLESKKQSDILQDKLNDEEIKSAGLNKQVAEMKNKNTDLYNTIEELKDKCAELERENTSLQKKVRNSTSKVRVENEMQELQDENRSLKNHLEGSYNRIKELQESKSQVQRELTEVQGRCELLQQDLNTTKNALECLREKYNNVNLQKLRENYELLLREKNNVVLEVEEKKMLIANKDQKLVEYSIEMDTLVKQKEELDSKIKSIVKEKFLLESQITNLVDNLEKLKEGKLLADIEKDEAYKLLSEEKTQLSLLLEKSRQEITELSTKNKELDEEMDELCNHINKQEDEIAELRDRLITGSFGGQNGLNKLKALEDENEKVKNDLRVTESNCSKLQAEIIRLNSEKEFLNSRIEDLNNKIGELESKNSSRCSSKSNSPNTRKGRRRHRRSDLYNQNRNLDFDNETTDLTDTDSPSATPTPPLINKTIIEECYTCIEFRNRFREMSLDLVSRNKKIEILEAQLQAENFPYQMKCNELQEQLLQHRAKNSDLKLEVQKLQRALMKDSSRECQVCRQKKLKKTEQSVQVNMDKLSMTGTRTGIVEDHVRLLKMEKERNLMKDLCRNRGRKIKELEQRLKEVEGAKIN